MFKLTICSASNSLLQLNFSLIMLSGAFKNLKSALMGLHLLWSACWYRNQLNAWSYNSWFHQHYVPTVKKKKSAKESISDSSQCFIPSWYRTAARQQLSAMLLHPNMILLYSPMDQGTLETLKKRCRYKLLS